MHNSLIQELKSVRNYTSKRVNNYRTYSFSEIRRQYTLLSVMPNFAVIVHFNGLCRSFGGYLTRLHLPQNKRHKIVVCVYWKTYTLRLFNTRSHESCSYPFRLPTCAITTSKLVSLYTRISLKVSHAWV